MIIEQTSTVSNQSGLQSHQFQLKASPHAFKILSSSLYTNKELAVLRELSANAWDSHLAANNPNPILIQLPTEMEPNLVVTDYGLGMDRSDVINLYTTYFSSSKQSSNELTGGFGIGSKSPFALTDTFTISTTKNGITFVATAYLNGGIPDLLPIQETQTDLPNQTIITVPISSKTTQERLYNSAVSLFVNWPVQPIVTKGSTTLVQLNAATTNTFTDYCKLDKYAGWRTHSFQSSLGQVTVGLFTYSVPNSLLDRIYNRYKEELHTLTKSTRGIYGGAHPVFHLLLPIGTIELSPSRETIEDTVANADTIFNYYSQASNHLVTTVLTNINSFISEFDNFDLLSFSSFDEVGKFVSSLETKYASDIINAIQGTIRQRIDDNIISLTSDTEWACSSLSRLPFEWLLKTHEDLYKSSFHIISTTRYGTAKVVNHSKSLGYHLRNHVNSSKVHIANAVPTAVARYVDSTNGKYTLDNTEYSVTDLLIIKDIELYTKLVNLLPSLFTEVPASLVTVTKSATARKTAVRAQADTIMVYQIVYDNTRTFTREQLNAADFYSTQLPSDALIYQLPVNETYSSIRSDLEELTIDFPVIVIQPLKSTELKTKRNEEFVKSNPNITYLYSNCANASQWDYFWNKLYSTPKYQPTRELVGILSIFGSFYIYCSDHTYLQNYRTLYRNALRYIKPFMSKSAYKLLISQSLPDIALLLRNSWDYVTFTRGNRIFTYNKYKNNQVLSLIKSNHDYLDILLRQPEISNLYRAEITTYLGDPTCTSLTSSQQTQ